MNLPLEAWMVGDTGLLPFPGHFALRVEGRHAAMAIVGRVGADADLSEAFAASRRLASVLSTAAAGPWADTDRHGLVRRAWQLLAELPGPRLGPAEGADLSLLLLAEDVRGMCVAGVGLAGVWALFGDQYRSLTTPGHPLLCAPGRPDSLPGVLTLDQPTRRVVGAPAHLEPVLPPVEALAARCGHRDEAGGAP